MKKKIISVYLSTLKYLAKAQLVKNKPLIIGITGSAGKSSCTKLVATVLKENFKVKYTKKGNSETGIPFEILNIPVSNYSLLDWFFILIKGFLQVLFNWEEYSILVVEMGIDSNQYPKDMETLLEIVAPDIGVLLNINNVHLQYFKGPKETKTIANEKIKLLLNLPENGLAIINNDQKELKNFDKKIRANLKKFSTSNNTDIKLTDHHVSLKESIFKFTYKNQNYQIKLLNQLAFKETFGNIATTFLIADFLKIDPKLTIKYIEKNYSTLPGRGIIFKGLNGSTIIDSSYNSSLEPTSASLNLLKELKTTKNRTIAILGDMRELGEKALDDHTQLEKVALKTADLVYTVGPLTTQYFKNKKIRKYANPFELIPSLKKEIKKGDIILIKGSQNTIFLESIVAELLTNQDNLTKLCRQTPYWEKQRKKLKKEI
jgi:UDP-N-acetylmuramoyl-tripeptide--D-alanyl-D-alanine ligase